MVILTFDDGVATKNLKHLNQLFDKKLINPNGCPMKYTFFINDIDNEYNVSTLLANKGHELASHSLTHKFPSSYWENISAKDFKEEMVGMKEKISRLSGVKVSGARTPFLKLNGDASYQGLKENGFVWDSSIVVGASQMNDKLPIWPFTLDKPLSKKYCVYSKCPNSSYPGLWELPLNRIYNEKKEACSLVDDCELPDGSQNVLKFLKDNFYNHYYTKKRAPFGMFLHISWLKWPSIFQSAKSFLAEVAQLDDVYVVTVSQAIDWVKNPTPLSQISNLKSWNCN